MEREARGDHVERVVAVRQPLGVAFLEGDVRDPILRRLATSLVEHFRSQVDRGHMRDARRQRPAQVSRPRGDVEHAPVWLGAERSDHPGEILLVGQREACLTEVRRLLAELAPDGVAVVGRHGQGAYGDRRRCRNLGDTGTVALDSSGSGRNPYAIR